jgi:hypothetical protein
MNKEYTQNYRKKVRNITQNYTQHNITNIQGITQRIYIEL